MALIAWHGKLLKRNEIHLRRHHILTYLLRSLASGDNDMTGRMGNAEPQAHLGHGVVRVLIKQRLPFSQPLMIVCQPFR